MGVLAGTEEDQERSEGRKASQSRTATMMLLEPWRAIATDIDDDMLEAHFIHLRFCFAIQRFMKTKHRRRLPRSTAAAGIPGAKQHGFDE